MGSLTLGFAPLTVLRAGFRGTDECVRPYVSMLVFAGLFWSQIAGVADFVNVEACGRELGNLPSAAGWEFDLKHLRSDEAASSAFVHGEEVAALPVPAVIAVIVVDADHHFQLR